MGSQDIPVGQYAPPVDEQPRDSGFPDAIELERESLMRTTGSIAIKEAATANGTAVTRTDVRFRGTFDRSEVEAAIRDWEAVSDHPLVATLIDFQTSDDHVTAVTERLDGGRLADRLASRDRILWLDETTWLIECLSAAVESAHDREILHLAVDPSTVAFQQTPDGVWDLPKLAGWGVRRFARENSAGVDAVDPRYAAPEQLDPDRFGKPDQRTDVYLLGALLYWLVAGKPLRDGSGYEAIADAVSGDAITPPSELWSLVPERLDEAVMRALETDRADRYGTVTEFRDALAEIQLPESARSAPEVGDYRQYAGGPANRGVASATSTRSGDPEEIWRTRVSGTVAVQPAVAYGTVYVGDGDGTVTAIRADTGDVRWETTADEYGVDASNDYDHLQATLEAPPAVDEGAVFVVSRSSFVALDARTGRKRWKRDLELDSSEAPTVADGTVYVCSEMNETVSALDVGSGETQWDAEYDAVKSTTPAVGDGIVAVCLRDGVCALDSDTGEHRWTFPIQFASPPSIADGRVYVSDDDTVYALDVETGAEDWRTDIEYPLVGPPVVDDAVYVTTNDREGSLRALDRETGELMWTYSLEDSDRIREPDGTPIKAGGELLQLLGSLWSSADDTQDLLAVDVSDGIEQWRYDLGEENYRQPAIVGDTLFVTTGSQDVVSLSLPDASEWDDPLDEPETDAENATERDRPEGPVVTRSDVRELRETIEEEDLVGLDKHRIADRTGWPEDKTEHVLEELDSGGVIDVDSQGFVRFNDQRPWNALERFCSDDHD